MIKKISFLILIIFTSVTMVACSSRESSVEFSYEDYMNNIKGKETKQDNPASTNTSTNQPKEMPKLTLTPDTEFTIDSTRYYYNGINNTDTISFQRYATNLDSFISLYYPAVEGSEFHFKKANMNAKILEINASTGEITLEFSVFK